MRHARDCPNVIPVVPARSCTLPGKIPHSDHGDCVTVRLHHPQSGPDKG